MSCYGRVVLAAGLLSPVAGAGGAAHAQSPAAAHAAALPPSGAPLAPHPGLRLLDVPFVPQTAALCGGAAVAMVMRFWGEPDIRAEDFAILARPGEAGISAADLERAVVERGWRALPFSGGLDETLLQLRSGRPVIALVREGGGRNHYIVLVGAAADRVLLHDPARGPFRVMDAAVLQQAWREAGDWALLILPPGPAAAVSSTAPILPGAARPEDDAGEPDTADGCALLVERGARLARAGEIAAAEELLGAALVLCDGTPGPLVELAGVRFRQKRWRDAEALAGRAARLQPHDAYTWDLLATTRFVQGDAAAALVAWNQIGAPRVDLMRVDGLARTRYEVVSRLLDQPPGTLLTAAALRRGRRRLATLPSARAVRIEYLPVPGGTAQLNVNVLERAPWSVGSPLLAAAAHALVEQTLRFDAATPTGNGELWSARARWSKRRPALGARVDLPSPWGALGVWHVEALWERQEIRVASLPRTPLDRLERRRSAFGCGQWASADWRWDVTGALEHWTAGAEHAALEIGLERRACRDRLMLRGAVSRAWSTRGGEPYATRELRANWCSSPGIERHAVRVLCRAGAAAASANAPRLLWPRAGAGPASTYLLRAHPSLDDGVLVDHGLTAELVHGGVEMQIWPWPGRLLALGVAAFVDAARPGAPFRSAIAPVQTDVGAGLRLQLPATNECLRLDVARGMRDGRMAFSLGIDAGR